MPAGSRAPAQPEPQPQPQHTRKRRRPDWDDFYRNGLPDVVIVIDDTPEPEAQPSVAPSQTLANGHSNAANASSSNDIPARHQAKRRKRDDEPTHYDPVYNNGIVGSHSHTSRQLASPSKSTVSSDRTNSAIHTTAATSLGSLSSSGQLYDYEVQPGQKRKRITRQQIANEAKRREADYQPPPFPPKKAPDVPVKVIPEVCFHCLPGPLAAC